MKTKSHLDTSFPLGPILMGIESALVCTLLLLLSTLGAWGLGFWGGREYAMEQSRNLFILISHGAETEIFTALGSFLLGFFSRGGFLLFVTALISVMLFLKSTTLRLDGLFGLAFSFMLGGHRTALDLHGADYTLNGRLWIVLGPLFLLYAGYRGLYFCYRVMSLRQERFTEEIELD